MLKSIILSCIAFISLNFALQASEPCNCSKPQVTNKACVCGCLEGKPCTCPNCHNHISQVSEPTKDTRKIVSKFKDYKSASKESVDTNKPLLVFYRCKAHNVDGFVVCETSDLEGVNDSCIIVSAPKSGQTYLVDTFKVSDNESMFREAVSKWRSIYMTTGRTVCLT